MYGYLPRAGVFVCDKRQLWATKTNHRSSTMKRVGRSLPGNMYNMIRRERLAGCWLSGWGGERRWYKRQVIWQSMNGTYHSSIAKVVCMHACVCVCCIHLSCPSTLKVLHILPGPCHQYSIWKIQREPSPCLNGTYTNRDGIPPFPPSPSSQT